MYSVNEVALDAASVSFCGLVSWSRTPQKPFDHQELEPLYNKGLQHSNRRVCEHLYTCPCVPEGSRSYRRPTCCESLDLKASFRISTARDGSTYFLLEPTMSEKRFLNSCMNGRLRCSWGEVDGHWVHTQPWIGVNMHSPEMNVGQKHKPGEIQESWGTKWITLEFLVQNSGPVLKRPWSEV